MMSNQAIETICMTLLLIGAVFFMLWAKGKMIEIMTKSMIDENEKPKLKSVTEYEAEKAKEYERKNQARRTGVECPKKCGELFDTQKTCTYFSYPKKKFFYCPICQGEILITE